MLSELESVKAVMDCMQIEDRNEGKPFARFMEAQATVVGVEENIYGGFLPQHSSNQLCSPQGFLTSRMFAARSKHAKRAQNVRVTLQSLPGEQLAYVGGELRQIDERVLLSMHNVARHFRLGTRVAFSSRTFCDAVAGGHGGSARRRMRDSVERLLSGKVEVCLVTHASALEVALLETVEFCGADEWVVTLSKNFSQIHQRSRRVFLDFGQRQQLPEGLATWFYGYVRSQTKLIPQALSLLAEASGSDANQLSFRDSLTVVMRKLVVAGVVDDGWSIKQQRLHWRKPPVRYEK
jgi:hypothetical protein